MAISLSKFKSYFGQLKLSDSQGNPVAGSDKLGAFLKEAFSTTESLITNLAVQGGLNPSVPVQPPPNIQSLDVSAQNGHFQVAIQDQSTGVSRQNQYFIEHADNPSFVNAHMVPLGQSRNANLFLGNVTRYFRAYSALPASGPSQHVYHGSAQAPVAVSGGGSVGGPAFLASQGSGTSAPGQTGYGPGPVPVRTNSNGFDWTRQQPIVTAGTGIGGGPSSLGPGTSPSGGGAGGGGGVVSALIIVDTYANWTTGKYPPASYPVGTLFVISNHNNVAYQVQIVAGSNAWVYFEGTYSVVQSGVSGVKGFNGAALGTNDTGLLINVTDYAHILQWNGSAFGWGPGELGSGYFQDFAVAPSGSGWQLCDGSAVHYLLATGALSGGTVTLPNTNSSAAYRKLGSSYSGLISAAVAPTVTPTGNVSSVFSGSPASLTTAAVTATGAVNAVTQVAGSGASYTPSGSVASVFTGIPDTTSLGGGDPIANFQAIQYFRL